MPRPTSDRVRKNYRLRPEMLARAQAALGTRTETETIETALRMVVGDVSVAASQPEPSESRGTGLGILKHFGTIPPDEADAMLRAIEEGCEHVNESGW